ncbi:MAG: DUF2914 domain-containing protein, partial [Thermodesulfobacteriota bacterium]|nr:DUF2914 domain-containing protein [Thermodesulfobacteriota bacterium]
MKQFFSVCCITAILLTLFNMTFLASVHAQESLSLTVENGAICLDVINREIIDAGTSFSVSVGKLYCFTRIVGAHNPTSVTHVWNYGETERARVTLEVNSANWRTYSS